MAARPYAIVSPDSPEGEERGRWDTGDSSMPDSQETASVGYVRDLLQRVEGGMNRVEHQLNEGLRRLEQDEDRRHQLHEIRDDKADAIIKAMADRMSLLEKALSDRVSLLENDKRRATDLFLLLKWVIGTFGASLIAGLLLAWNIITGNATLMEQLEVAGRQRNAQNQEIQQELQSLKREVAPQSLRPE